MAVISLALAIGANTAVFSLYNSLMLKPLPVSRSRAIARAHLGRRHQRRLHPLPRVQHADGRDRRATWFPIRSTCALRDRTADVAELFAFSEFNHFDPLTVVAGGETSTAPGLIVSGNFFEGLGVPGARGPDDWPDDDRAEAEPVAVISHAAWTRCFKGDPQALGRTVLLNRQSFTIVGVSARGLPRAGGRQPMRLLRADVRPVAGPTGLSADRIQNWWVQVMARLSSGR